MVPFDADSFTPFLGALALACGAAPLGVLLIGRRMSLVGDSLSHATLPGAAIVYVLLGSHPWLLTAGALAAGVIVAVSSTALARFSRIPEDAAFAVLYLSTLAIGILVLGRSVSAEVVHGLLFGDMNALDLDGLAMASIAAAATLAALASFGARLQAAAGGAARVLSGEGLLQMLLMALVALNLVAGFRAFGSLMTVGLMMVPAATASLWGGGLTRRVVAAIALSAGASIGGLAAAVLFQVEPGPAMVATASLLFLASLVLGRRSAER